MSSRGALGAQFHIELAGLDSTLRDLQYFSADVKRLVNGQLRRDSKRIAESALPLVRRLVAAGPAPQSRKMSDTVRAKSDRMPTIRVGAVNPRLSGFRPRRAGSARERGSLAWGIEKGPAGGPRTMPPTRKRNVYRVPRSVTGHVLGPNMTRIADAVVPAYADALAAAMDRAHLYTRTTFGR